MELKVEIAIKGAIFDGKVPEIINAELTAAMHEATQLIEANVKRFTPQGVYGAQGGLLATIHGEVVNKGTPIVKGIVAHSSVYGDVVEKGRTAGKGMPPGGAIASSLRAHGKRGIKKHQVYFSGPLIRWIEVKLGVDNATAGRLEFVIRRKIGQKGFPGAHMFEKGLNASMPALDEIFDRRGFSIARKLNE
jgi:hypothetical protein